MAGSTADLVNRRTTTEVLRALDGEFASVGTGVSNGLYSFWLGSGISRDAVPSLPELLRKASVFLQQRVSHGDPGCRFRLALTDVFKAGSLSNHEIEAIDLDQPVDTWPDVERLLDRLVTSYSKILEVEVREEEFEDYLLWEAVDVRAAYADDALSPDAEHLCLAILILEGVIPVMASANWDGLIEKALHRLNGDVDGVLRVLVRPEEYRQPHRLCDLIKFHGCAIRAAKDPDQYRKMLVARKSQITGWVPSPSYAVVVDRLIDIVATRRTLMVGLSAQDEDVQQIFSRATARLAWGWDSDPSAVVFAEEQIGTDQVGLLKLVYSTDYFPNREEIMASARLGSYGKPLLLGLVLYVLAEKLVALVAPLDGCSLSSEDSVELGKGIRVLRDRLGAAVNNDFHRFTVELIQAVAFGLGMFRHGVPPHESSETYEPLSGQPMKQTQADPNFSGTGLRMLAVVVSLLGKGAMEGCWELEAGDPSDPRAGNCKITGDQTRRSRAFLVRDSAVLAKLEAEGYVDLSDPDVLAIHATSIAPRQRHSPARNFGRSIERSGRQVDIGAVVEAANGAEELFERFRQEAAI